jgi:hypothetical protein
MKSLRGLVLLVPATAMLLAQAKSEWVYFGPDHKLHYRADAQGNRIMDFSSAGYKGGGVKLPDVPAVKTLSAAAGDNTAQIQAALDEVSKAGGAVVLRPGTYELAGTLKISASGVVLRGSGAGDGGTTIQLTGVPHRFLEIRGSGSWRKAGEPAAIADAYVPAGAVSIHVSDSAGFKAGDTVLIERPVTEAWVHFMGMDTLVRDGKPQTWIKAGASIRTDRVVKSVSGKTIVLDVPLSDSIDGKYLNPPGATIVKYSFPGRISGVGVENLRVAAPADDTPIIERQYTVLLIDTAIEAWARDIAVQETQNSVTTGAAAKRVTLDRVRIVHSIAHSGAAAPADFAISGTQIFLNRCSVSGAGTWPVVTQATVTGPNVVLNFSSDERGVAPHQRWATGLLVDSAQLKGSTERAPGIAFSNRKTAGSGHGWDIGWGVAWNVTSPFLLVQAPPGAMNWCIGCVGEQVKTEPVGIFDSPGKAVEPASLYLEQLRERLGEAAVKAIGY